MQQTIFVVDDNDINLTMAKNTLKDQYRVMTLPSAAKMFALMEKVRPDLILLDIQMPEIDGFEALRLLKSNDSYSDIPVIFLTGMADESAEVRGFELGVIDFVAKPFSSPILLNRIKTHLNIDALIRERTEQLRHKTVQLQNLQNNIVFAMADMVENRDEGTGGHVERTAAYIKILVDEMKARKIYADEIKEIDMDLFVSSARLHDVGKISVSDLILNKQGKLTDEEYAVMKTHCAEGERIINTIVSKTDDDVEFLRNAKLFAAYHHERWDGRGYPHELSGTDIPLQGRLMAIVDVYDALMSERPYKKPFTPDEAMNIIVENAGKQFDPLIGEVFSESKAHFEAINLPRINIQNNRGNKS